MLPVWLAGGQKVPGISYRYPKLIQDDATICAEILCYAPPLRVALTNFRHYTPLYPIASHIIVEIKKCVHPRIQQDQVRNWDIGLGYRELAYGTTGEKQVECSLAAKPCTRTGTRKIGVIL